MYNNHLALLTFFDGVRLLNKPGIRPYVIVPLLINMLVFAGVIYGCYQWAFSLQQTFQHWLPSWLAFASYLIWPVLVVLLLLFIIYGFTVVANIIAAPFNSFLSEAVDRYCAYPCQSPALTVATLIAVVLKSMVREIRKMLYGVKWWVLAFMLSFIPVVNVCSLVIAAWLMAIQYLDYAADNHQVRFSEALVIIKQQRINNITLGAWILLFNAIPVINLLVMPAAVCAATLRWHQLQPAAKTVPSTV